MSDEEYYGCGDGGCIFGPPKGMHTNGGCQCLKSIGDIRTRIRVHRAVAALRKKVVELEEETEA